MTKILTARQEQNFFDKISMIPGGCHEWLGSLNGRDGYGQFRIDGRIQYAHRVAWALEHGRWPTEMILHKCDNRSCVNSDHLYEGTHSQNAIDKAQRGPLNSKQKLTPDDVHKVRHLLCLGCYTQEEIGKMYGVDQRTISDINIGENWSHV